MTLGALSPVSQLTYDSMMTLVTGARAFCLMVLLSAPAWAHVKLVEPTDWLVTDGLGDPQKTGPCGAGGPLSKATTTVVAGSTLHVKWKETVLHPGHFRIAITDNRGLLQDPQVTSSNGQCLSAAIQSPVAAPVLVDGLFAHTSPAPNNTYETDVTVPNLSCDHCTLQLIQFMSSHSTPCIYYHCADLKIVAAGSDAGTNVIDAGAVTPPVDAGVSAADGGSTTGPPPSSGCQSVGGASLLGALALVRVRRRR